MKRLSILLFILCSFLLQEARSQGIAIGQWRDHLPFNTCIAVAEAGSRIYSATSFGIFYYDKSDQSVSRMSKVNGLSDIGIISMAYSMAYKTLVIAYTNTNIDLIADDKVINIPDIKRKPILGNKSINRVVVVDRYAYLCCGFGIVVLDLKKLEIKDTYYIGPDGSALEVTDITTDSLYLYATTESGLYKASLSNPVLANFAAWTKDTTMINPDARYNTLAWYRGRLIVNMPGPTYYTDTMFINSGNGWDYYDKQNTANRTRIHVSQGMLVLVNVDNVMVRDTSLQNAIHIYEYLFNDTSYSPASKDALLDAEHRLWIADYVHGMVGIDPQRHDLRIRPNGPGSNKVFALDCAAGRVVGVPGGRNTSWGNVWEGSYVYNFEEESWFTNDRLTDPAMDSLKDFVVVAVDPLDSRHVYAGSWGYGLVEYQDGRLKAQFGASNSTLQQPPTYPDWNVKVGGLKYDIYNNLWIINSSAPNLVNVRKHPGGEWRSFNLGNLYPGATSIDAGDFVIDKYGQKWILLRGNKVLVYTDNYTIDNPNDDKAVILTAGTGKGNIPGARVTSIACDREGLVWLGTDEGVVVFYAPENVFTGSNFDAQRVYVTVGGYTQYLLETETVIAIAIDGADRKWFGTERAGVFLMSADGTQQISHFTEDNSPLLSDQITTMTINGRTGEIFFGTSNGIISYKGTATTGGETSSNVLVYPNPVKPGYDGVIAIKGLVEDADVKITDISGGLVFHTKAQGGQAIWNGKNYEGEKAATGVYLVFISNEDGSETFVTKILFQN